MVKYLVSRINHRGETSSFDRVTSRVDITSKSDEEIVTVLRTEVIRILDRVDFPNRSNKKDNYPPALYGHSTAPPQARLAASQFDLMSGTDLIFHYPLEYFDLVESIITEHKMATLQTDRVKLVQRREEINESIATIDKQLHEASQ